MKPNRYLASGFLAILLFGGPSAFSDAVTDWNAAFESSLAFPSERGPAVPNRPLAIMHAAMFDAVNGISGKYTPIHVTDPAPPGARAEAAAIQAAYTVMSVLRPGSQAVWDAQLQASLAALPGTEGNSTSIMSGREWGAWVANSIISWRAQDGTTTPLPPFVGHSDVGYWRHPSLTTPATAGYQNLAIQPFLVVDPAAFDPGPPYGFANRLDALASASYAADLNEVAARGSAASAVRTAQDEFMSLFIHACDQATLNRMLRDNLPPGSQLVDNARAFALLNIAYFDTLVVFFRSKYQHEFWRPFQAIWYADVDGNATTTKDAAWTALRPTPPHPEYPSAHVTLFTALVHVAARIIGERPVSLYAPGYADSVAFPSMSAISDANVLARIDIGWHFRETGEVSQVIGRAIADYLVDGFLTPAHQH